MLRSSRRGWGPGPTVGSRKESLTQLRLRAGSPRGRQQERLWILCLSYPFCNPRSTRALPDSGTPWVVNANLNSGYHQIS
ncbi:hypothetical protein P7K49_013909 [Saguinus oedipus]|uniref:Uncharacterized protein n=1 Tax=Saguinus oedipus TaxID=9490 RepID=A0ABQ9VIN0_SAGOE|nr:hypothetical protein P7K49_013909 [Saguinus oedipus]